MKIYDLRKIDRFITNEPCVVVFPPNTDIYQWTLGVQDTSFSRLSTGSFYLFSNDCLINGKRRLVHIEICGGTSRVVVYTSWSQKDEDLCSTQ